MMCEEMIFEYWFSTIRKLKLQELNSLQRKKKRD